MSNQVGWFWKSEFGAIEFTERMSKEKREELKAFPAYSAPVVQSAEKAVEDFLGTQVLVHFTPREIVEKFCVYLLASGTQPQPTKEQLGQELRLAFMHGAKWWEFHSTKGTMWQSDQHLVAEEAERRYHGYLEQSRGVEDYTDERIEMLFDQWWESDGQYVRSGGTSYSRVFAYEAFAFVLRNYATPPPSNSEKVREAVEADLKNILNFLDLNYDAPTRYENIAVMKKFATRALAAMLSSEANP